VLGRRSVVLTFGVAALGLGACDSEPADDRETPSQADSAGQPGPPRPLADTDLLLETWQDTQELELLAGDVSPPPEARESLTETTRILGIQEAVLARLVRAQRGATAPLPKEVSRATQPPDVVSQTGAPRSDLGRLATALSPVEDTPQKLSAVSGSNLPTLLSLHGVRYACAERLGSPPGRTMLAGPTRAAAITLLAGLRQAVYGFEVLAARSSGEERERHRSALMTLRPLTRTVTELAGPAAPAAPLGYGWEQRLETESDRRRAARELAGALPAAVMAGASARAGDVDAIDGSLQALAAVLGVGVAVGVPVSGFPGLTVPAFIE